MRTLINDKRLTPTMERVRSGRTQMFREKNTNDMSFINRDNSDVILEHENKAMYAELIDGEWYWINGCAECNGKDRDWMTYVECDNHDRCSVCFISRKEIQGPVHASKKGWICKPCNESKKLETKTGAFKKLDGEEPDCSYRDNIICPHCGSEISNDDIHESRDLVCHVCEGEMTVEVEYTASYSTTIKGKLIKG